MTDGRGARGFDPGPVLPADVVEHARTAGSLDGEWIWIALTVFAIACLVFWFWLRQRKVKKSILLVGVVVFALLAGLAGLNSYVGYIRTPHDLGMVLARGPSFIAPLGRMIVDDTNGGDQDDPGARGAKALKFARSARAGGDQPRLVRIPLPDPGLTPGAGSTNVLLPPGYDDPANANRRYPVVYLIHGYPGGTSDDWFTAGDAVGTMNQLYSHHLVRPMILVGADMTAGDTGTDWECLNVPHGPRLESYLTEHVVGQIDHRFRTLADRGDRAIGGMSGGGFCALNVGLRHLPEFATMLITLPYDTLGTDASLLGGDKALAAANDPRAYIPRMRFTQPIAAMIDAGMGSRVDVQVAKRLARSLLARGQRVALREEPGMNHTWNTARAALPFLIAFADQQFPRTTDVQQVGVPGRH